MWTTEHEHITGASPADIFALWRDVEGWPAWDGSLIVTSLDGPFAAGSTGTLHPVGMPEPIAFTVTEVEDGQGFADETRLGPLVLRDLEVGLFEARDRVALLVRDHHVHRHQLDLGGEGRAG